MSTLAHLLVDLLSTAPALVPIYREHLALHDALLPDLFMAQVASWVSGTMHTPGARTIAVTTAPSADQLVPLPVAPAPLGAPLPTAPTPTAP